MLDARWRANIEKGLAPVGRALKRSPITADQLTIVGLLLAVATALVIADGHLLWGLAGVIATGVVDLLDGQVARHSGQANPRGAFFDSVSDRVSDAALLGGIAWYLSGSEPRLAVLALAVVALTMLITYERARAESLGFDGRGGLMERAERLVLIGVGLAFDVLIPVLWIMLVLTAFTAIFRFVKVWRQASSSIPRVAARRVRRYARREDNDREVVRSGGIARWWEARRPDRARAGSRPARRRTRP